MSVQNFVRPNDCTMRDEVNAVGDEDSDLEEGKMLLALRVTKTMRTAMTG